MNEEPKRRFNPKYVTVFSKNGYHCIRTPNGEEISLESIMSTVVQDEGNTIPVVTVKLLCNLE